jgi:hypothetical protein
MIDEKQLENMEYLNCLDSMTTNDARCTRKIKFKEENNKVLHLEHSLVWC